MPKISTTGGKVDHTGQSDIQYVAVRYKGPYPPTKHRYTFRVEALNAKGKELVAATAVKSFP